MMNHTALLLYIIPTGAFISFKAENSILFFYFDYEKYTPSKYMPVLTSLFVVFLIELECYILKTLGNGFLQVVSHELFIKINVLMSLTIEDLCFKRINYTIEVHCLTVM